MPIHRVNKASLWLAASLLFVARYYFTAWKNGSNEPPDFADRQLSHQVLDGTQDGGRRLQTVQIRFMLINANTDKEITNVDLNTNGTFALSNLPTNALNIQANVTVPSKTRIGSVVFDFNTKIGYRSDSSFPYALCSESKGNFRSCGSVLGAGRHVVKATVRRNGTAIGSKTISFQRK
jgi:hypothetical protein